MKKVAAYTDGACRGNPGPGGWAAILVYKNTEHIINGAEVSTTNNRMELTAAIRALSALKEPCEVDLYTDSSYVVDSINQGWAQGWRRTNWKNGKAKNPDLWEQLLNLCEVHRVTFHWIRGHNGHPYNERCDKIATEAADSVAVNDK